MTVAELIAILETSDKTSGVRVFWDGEDRGDVEGVFIHSGDGFTERGTLVIVGDWCIYRGPVAARHKIIYPA